MGINEDFKNISSFPLQKIDNSFGINTDLRIDPNSIPYTVMLWICIRLLHMQSEPHRCEHAADILHISHVFRLTDPDKISWINIDTVNIQNI